MASENMLAENLLSYRQFYTALRVLQQKSFKQVYTRSSEWFSSYTERDWNAKEERSPAPPRKPLAKYCF